MRVERRGRLIDGLFARATGFAPGRTRVSGSGSKDKPFDIPKQLVWEAYKKVKANKGAAGVDRQSMEAFEVDLRNNLYKIWNRMSSGTYFPPPVMGGDSQGWRGHENFRRADRGRPGRADGGRAGAAGPYGGNLSQGLLRVPASAGRVGRGGQVPPTVLEEGLGDRP